VDAQGQSNANAPTVAPSEGCVEEVGASLVGRSFGDFELVEELGRGGMGVVYKARQASLDRFVAVKLLLAEHARNPVLLARFLAEARAVARLTHPNIVSIYQVGECFARPYFVMEFIEGQSLEAILQSRQVPIPWTVALMSTITDAIHVAHGKGIVHRDLKPANILLSQGRRPVVMDFGIAKFVGKSSGLTQQGAIMGTPAYMPPEQAGEDYANVGPHSDVYSLGAILYTLLTGRVPYDEGTVLRTILKVISDDLPPPPHAIRPGVPPRLEQICLRAMSKKPADRYPSAHALAEDLRRFRATLSQQSNTFTLRPAGPTVILTSRATGKAVQLFNPASVIGRALECDLVLKVAEVSKRHCQLLLSAEQVLVEDLDSVNGTRVNGKRIRRTRLRDGDELNVAGHVFTVEIQGLAK
jgi:serine/threonine-protein kinase